MNRTFFSIRMRVLLLLGSIFLIMLGMSAYFTLAERQSSLSDAREDLRTMASRIAFQQSQVVDYAHQMVTLLPLTHDMGARFHDGDCHQFLAQILEREPRFANIGIADHEGRVFCNSAVTEKPVDISDRPYFKKVLATDRIVIGRAMHSRSTGAWSLPFARAIHDAAGHLGGYLVVLVDLNWVNRELAQAKMPEGARIGLVDGDGTILARYPDPDRWVGRNAAHTAFFATISAMHGSGTAESDGFDGVSRIYGFANFAQTSSGPIYLWVGLPRQDVAGPAERKFIWTFSVILLLSAMTFTLVWFGSERWLLRPLSIISNTVRRLGQGEHNARTGLDPGEGELGELAHSIDRMAVALLSSNEIIRLNRALRVLSRCNKVLVRSEEESQLLLEICRTIVETGNYRMAWVGYAGQDSDKTVRPVAEYGIDEGYLDALDITWADTERGRGPTGTAIRTGMPQINQDFLHNLALLPWREDAVKRGYRSSSAWPLKNEAGVFGALTIYSPESDAFNDDEMHLLEELAEDLAFGIDILRLRGARDEWAVKLERAMEGAIQATATMLEKRDPYTAGHQKSVAALATAIARELKLSEDEIRGIHLAAMVHDIGKVQVPAEILVKPSRLTPIEHQLIQEHAAAGYEILKDIDFPWPIAELVYQHHERMDGSGYPRGLKTGELLIGARILAVADTVESMASHRPYRPALGIKAALKEIREGSGKIYDPEVVAVCIALFDERRFSFGA